MRRRVGSPAQSASRLSSCTEPTLSAYRQSSLVQDDRAIANSHLGKPVGPRDRRAGAGPDSVAHHLIDEGFNEAHHAVVVAHDPASVGCGLGKLAAIPR